MHDRLRSDTEVNPSKKIGFVQRLSFKMGLGVVLFIILVMAANYYVLQTRGREVIVEQADKLNQKIGQTITLKLRERLAATESLTTALANLGIALQKNTTEFHQVIPFLIAQAGMEQLIAGGGIWPEPGAFIKGVDRQSFFWGRNSKGELEFYDNYNDPAGKGYHHEEWYVPARFLRKGEVYWSKSYRDPYSLEPMVTCTVPMWNDEGFQGVATIDLKLIGLSDFMAKQAELIGGYAFAVDRNNRLLSFPDAGNGLSVSARFRGTDHTRYPTVQELALSHPEFSNIEAVLNELDDRYQARVSDSSAEKLRALSQKIASASYQIDEYEAANIAAVLLGRHYLPSSNKYFSSVLDPVLNEPVSVSVFAMPDTGWKVIIAMPARYAKVAVAQIKSQMLSLLFVLVVLAAILFGLFFNTAFLSSVSRLTSQIRRLVSREDYVTRLRVEGSDELAHLASWFNIRTAQLSDVLNVLRAKNQALEEARKDAEQANRSKNVFLASMSHEIRTPMNAIIGMSEVLERTSLEPDQENYVSIMSTSAQALLSLINDIMDFSKVEANQLDLEQIPFDLRKALDDCADLIAFQANEKNLEFVYFMSPDINRHVIGDPGRLRQIILNLASNAVKFTSTGRVELWIEPTSQNAQTVNILIEVRDTGIGLSEQAQSSLFMPFAQGDNSTTRKHGGSGLGLTISQHLSALMGGRIEFRSEEGVGTTFTFNLKLAVESGKNWDSPLVLRSDVADRPRNKVLILGQSQYQVAVIERYVSALGYEAVELGAFHHWVAELEKCSEQDILSICCDEGLLGDPNALADRLPTNLKRHQMIVLGVRHQRFEVKIVKQMDLPVLFASQPLKFDALRALIETNNNSREMQDGQLIAKAPKPDLDLQALSHKRLLVVEDNKVNQQVILLMLKKLGLKADVANDGVEALEIVQYQHYDMILMDWQMPRMDGLEATRRIRAGRHNPKQVIIAVTANAMSGDVEKCLNAGMNDYISKPIRRDRLISLLTQWLH